MPKDYHVHCRKVIADLGKEINLLVDMIKQIKVLNAGKDNDIAWLVDKTLTLHK